MSFDSPRYVLFLSVTVLLHRFCPRRLRWGLLLLCSLFFYACWSPPLTLAIVGVIALTYFCGLMTERPSRPSVRKFWVFLACAGCLGLLFWFKYFEFLAHTLIGITGGTWRPMHILLPVGCSFYTFQALSYVIDVYRGDLSAVRHPGQYALYIAFFPQLVAGPIERAGALLPQLAEGKTADRAQTVQGLKLLLTGYFRKLVIADMAAPVVNSVFAAASPDGSAVLLALVLFAFQIYCDFAGYSEIARGSAYLLGIRLRRNFDRPYLSHTVREFWQRWHMSLTGWFRDYVYIPLGGSRKGIGRQIAATMTVFILSGLWHGANWTFLCWGLFHGLLCCAEILLSRRGPRARFPFARRVVCMSLVLLSWLLFRAESLTQAGRMLLCLFRPWNPAAGLAVSGLSLPQALCLLLGLSQLPALHRAAENEQVPDTVYLYLLAGAVIAWFLRAESGGAGTFIYFQF